MGKKREIKRLPRVFHGFACQKKDNQKEKELKNESKPVYTVDHNRMVPCMCIMPIDFHVLFQCYDSAG